MDTAVLSEISYSSLCMNTLRERERTENLRGKDLIQQLFSQEISFRKFAISSILAVMPSPLVIHIPNSV